VEVVVGGIVVVTGGTVVGAVADGWIAADVELRLGVLPTRDATTITRTSTATAPTSQGHVLRLRRVCGSPGDELAGEGIGLTGGVGS